MIKEALQYIMGLGKAEIHEENGQTFSDKPLSLLRQPTADSFAIHTLDGLIDYIKADVDIGEKIIVHVESPTSVHVSSLLNGDKKRDYFVSADALVPEIGFGSRYWYNPAEFNVKLQSCFLPNVDRDAMLKLVGNIKEDNVKNYKDDGTSQMVVAKAGVASVANVEVPNPVTLAPYRTFVEVKQPESEFIFRMENGPKCALFEADGGAWRNKAIKNIEDYLEGALLEEIQAGTVVLIA